MAAVQALFITASFLTSISFFGMEAALLVEMRAARQKILSDFVAVLCFAATCAERAGAAVRRCASAPAGVGRESVYQIREGVCSIRFRLRERVSGGRRVGPGIVEKESIGLRQSHKSLSDLGL
jgi:hypothetical protein